MFWLSLHEPPKLCFKLVMQSVIVKPGVKSLSGLATGWWNQRLFPVFYQTLNHLMIG